MPNYDDLFLTQPEEDNAEQLQPFDTNAFKERKQRERTEAFALIDSSAEEMKSTGELFKTYLDVQAHFDRYSVSNAILIAAQMPEATKLMDFDDWKKAGVSIKKGESAITILKAGKEFERPDHSVGVYYNAAKVFDISQTTSRMKGVSTTQLDERLLLKALITNAPCKMEVSDALSEHLNALYDPEQKTIFVRRGLDGPTIFRSLSQELAHAHLDRGENNRSENSLTAYCASYMLCKKYGISVDTYTFEPMPEKFCQMETADFRQELGKIRDAFKELHAEMTRNMDKMEPSEKPKKERTGDAR